MSLTVINYLYAMAPNCGTLYVYSYIYVAVDCRRPLLVEDCQHCGRTCASLMMHCASFMTHMRHSATLAILKLWQNFKYQKYDLEDFFT